MIQKSTDDKIVPVQECPMCGEENVKLIDICSIHNPEHKICDNCVTKLIEKYSKEFCAYCGERPVIINIPIAVRVDPGLVNITNDENHESRCEKYKKKYKWLINVISAIICYVALILNWHLYRMINHYMDNGEPLNKEIDWHIYNALYALFIDTCIFLCLVNMCERYIK